MSTFGRSVGGGRRQTSRESSQVLAEISTVDDDRRVALLNVSKRGARLVAPELPAENAYVILRADDLEAFGRVVCSRNGQCGILFEPPISASAVEQLRVEDVRIAA